MPQGSGSSAGSTRQISLGELYRQQIEADTSSTTTDGTSIYIPPGDYTYVPWQEAHPGTTEPHPTQPIIYPNPSPIITPPDYSMEITKLTKDMEDISKKLAEFTEKKKQKQAMKEGILLPKNVKIGEKTAFEIAKMLVNEELVKLDTLQFITLVEKIEELL
jgi:hypothetical protein